MNTKIKQITKTINTKILVTKWKLFEKLSKIIPYLQNLCNIFYKKETHLFPTTVAPESLGLFIYRTLSFCGLNIHFKRDAIENIKHKFSLLTLPKSRLDELPNELVNKLLCLDFHTYIDILFWPNKYWN